MSFSFLIVLPKDSRSAVAPLPRPQPAIFAGALATSKFAPFFLRPAGQRISGAGGPFLPRNRRARPTSIAQTTAHKPPDQMRSNDEARGLRDVSKRNSPILFVHGPVTYPLQNLACALRRPFGGAIPLDRNPEGESKRRLALAWFGRFRGVPSCHLRLLGSVARPPAPSRRVPRGTASGPWPAGPLIRYLQPYRPSLS